MSNTNGFPSVTNSERLANNLATQSAVNTLLGSKRQLVIDAGGAHPVFTVVDGSSKHDLRYPQFSGKTGDWILKLSNGEVYLAIKL